MKVATRPNELQQLEEQLQQHLQAVGFNNLALKLNCAFLEETLLVIGEHPAQTALKVEATLAVLQEAVLALHPKSVEQVGLCLKIVGQKQPYAFHSFSIQQPEASKAIFSPVEEDLIAPDPEEEAEEFEGELDAEQESLEAEDLAEESYETENHAQPISSLETDDLAQNPFDATDVELLPQSQVVVKKKERSPVSLVPLFAAAGAGAVAAFVLICVWVVSRPCVLAECTAIPSAKQLSQESLKTIKQAKSNSAREAKPPLTKAITALETIPFWSFRYGEAQKLLKDYQQQGSHLEAILKAQDLANQAVQKAQNPPHQVENWQEVQSQWQTAVNSLEKVPPNSPAYALAQKKLKEYKSNLTTVGQRLTREKQGAEKLNTAKSLAQIAEAREGVAQVAETWEKVQSGWQSSVNVLSEIPENTMAYEEAKVLLPKYETKLAQARENRTLEQISQDAYTEAVTSAAQAKVFEQRNVWFQATEYWRKALTYAEQVPESTSYSAKMQPLLASYKASLQQAEIQWQAELRLQKARNDLSKVCKGTPTVCTYTVSHELIAVQMTPAYVQKLHQTFLKAGNKDQKTQQAVTKHIETLQVALEAISDNAGIPLKVYDAEGKRIGTHLPD